MKHNHFVINVDKFIFTTTLGCAPRVYWAVTVSAFPRATISSIPHLCSIWIPLLLVTFGFFALSCLVASSLINIPQMKYKSRFWGTDNWNLCIQESCKRTEHIYRHVAVKVKKTFCGKREWDRMSGTSKVSNILFFTKRIWSEIQVLRHTQFLLVLFPPYEIS